MEKGFTMRAVSHRIPTEFGNEVYVALEDFDRRLYFRWDLTTDTINLNEPVPQNNYDIPLKIACASSMLWHSALIHPDETHLLRVYLHTIFRHRERYRNRTRNTSCKMRLRDRSRMDYLWSEIHIITYYDGLKPVVAYGNIRNIQAQKLWQQRVEREAAHDKLTGLLNKDACKKRIVDYLSGLSRDIDQAAMLLIDADGFKGINDTFGHLFGDAVLTDMGNAIIHNFRHSDIKGRIGGDEFIVLFRNMTNVPVLKDRCERLIHNLNRKYKNGKEELPFSISIGASFYPEHGTSYTELFKHADRALYEAKSQGKNQYMIYHPSLIGQASVTNHRAPVDFEGLQQKAFKDNMIEFIFRLLYETNSPEATISLSLGMFGKQFNLDRVAVDRFNPATNQYTTAFEWLSPNGVSLKPQEHREDISRLLCLRNNMVLSGYKATSYGVMSICEDTAEKEEKYQECIQFFQLGAFAHCLISHGSDTLGCIGFESTAPHVFKEEAIRELSIFAVILGNILLTPHDDNKLRQQNAHLRDLLDHMQEIIYVIDKITMQPVYFNRTIRQALPDGMAKQPCYQLFHKRQTPCPDCPVQKLSGEGSEYIQCEIDNWNSGAKICSRACNLFWDDTSGRPLALVIQEPF